MRFPGLIVGLLASLPLSAAPFLEKADLYQNDTGSYAHYRIPGLVVTARGVVLATCEARLRGNGDWDKIDFLLRRSLDGGKTWSEPKVIGHVPGPKAKNPVSLRLKGVQPQDVTYDNCVLIADRDGPVHCVFCMEYSHCYYMRSDDDGQTFSQPVEITAAFQGFKKDYDWKVIATGPAHSIELANGRLVVPIWMSLGTGEGAHRPSETATIYSDDKGKTWHRGDIAVPDTKEWVYPNETVAIQLADGRVMLNVRSESPTHRRLVTVSDDGAHGWSTPRFEDALLEPICQASMVRDSSVPGRSVLLFANPDNLAQTPGRRNPGGGGDRKNLSVKASFDEATTWPVDRVLEPGPSSYSDLAVLKDGTILCFYERHRPTPGGRSPFVLTLARFNFEWLTQGSKAR